MKNLRTLVGFQEALDHEMSWRVKEIGVFKVASRKNGPQNKSFIRAGVALTYAHWEGFIKNSSEMYLQYVGNKRLSYKELKSCFASFGVKGHLNTIMASSKSEASSRAFDFIIENLDSVANISKSDAINTQSNLSSSVFANIAHSLNIDTSPYDTRFNLIDQKLVERRNAIAHGEYLAIKGEDFSVLVTEVLELMRHYKTDLENAASLEDYRR